MIMKAIKITALAALLCFSTYLSYLALAYMGEDAWKIFVKGSIADRLQGIAFLLAILAAIPLSIYGIIHVVRKRGGESGW